MRASLATCESGVIIPLNRTSKAKEKCVARAIAVCREDGLARVLVRTDEPTHAFGRMDGHTAFGRTGVTRIDNGRMDEV